MEKYSILILAVMVTVSSAFAPVLQIRRSVVAFSSKGASLTISMPPNADQLHLRQPLTDINVDTSAHLDISIQERVDSIQNLKDTEFAIDGIIYDTQGFKHPGGDSFLAFGGNDVTAMYHMIHPLHTPNHLKKLKKVGRVLDWKQEYEFDSEFAQEIKREVFKIVKRGNEIGTPGFMGRAIAYVLFMSYCQFLWTTRGASFGLGLAFGVAHALIGMNVQHDANHGAASKIPWLNDLMGFGADSIGGQKWNWFQQHWTHHSFTNNPSKDPDKFSAEPVTLFNDYPLGNEKRKFFHRFQALFFIPMWSFYWLHSILHPQSYTLEHAGAYNMGLKMKNEFTRKRRKYAVAIRLLYIYLNIYRPLVIGGMNKLGITMIQILFMGACGSLTLGILFSLSHNFETVERDPTKSFRETGKPVCWYKAQVETTSTYGAYIAGALTGGLNLQVEHHLFPRMSSAYYPRIAPTIRAICKKYGVQYVYYPWIWQNFISTLKYMHKAGTGEHWKNPLSGNL